MIDEQLRAYLLTLPAVTAITSSAFVERATQGTAAPYFVIGQTGGNPEQHAGGTSGVHRSFVEVVCYGATAVKAAQLADVVETALAAVSGTMGTADVRACIATGRQRATETPQQGDQTGYPAVSLSFDVFHR